MAMDSLHGDHGEDTLVVLARDEHGAIRGVLHFVPCYGRSAMSLSFMRRDPRTPNGLTEFMVVSAVELLRERGVDEMSLLPALGAPVSRVPGGARTAADEPRGDVGGGPITQAGTAACSFLSRSAPDGSGTLTSF
jgi:lysyl-tRNA synthetase class 2